MKKLFLVLVLCLCSLASWAQYYDFSAVAPTGQTLYYRIASNNTVEVICPNVWNWEGFDAPTGDLTIPNTVRYNNVDYSVTSIGMEAFHGCSGLTSVTIPDSVTSIGTSAFSLCRGLTNIVIDSSVNSIDSNAFHECQSLKTVYWLGSGRMEPTTFNSHYFGGRAGFVCRVIRPIALNAYGSGNNITYLMHYDKIRIVDEEDGNSSHIPYSQLPANFIGMLNGSSDWVAREILLTDGQDAFEAPETFTAGTVTYTREFTNSNRSTLCLPFTAAIPEDFEVYDFTNFANNTISFSKREDSIYAYTPYLVGYNLSKDGNTTKCTFTQENVVFPQTFMATPACTTTYNGMTFKGTMERTCMNSTNYGYKDGFFVQSADGSEHDAHAHVNPFRAYFEITSGDAPQSLPRTLNVEVGYGDPVGIDAAETPEQEYVNRYGKDVYDMLGRLVRKNADNLEGLPKGVYIWKGRKHVMS